MKSKHLIGLEELSISDINEIINMIQDLIDKDHAYEAEAHILFNVKSFKGTSSHHNTLKKSLRDGELIEIKYNGGSQKNKFRPIRPISLIPRPNGLCLYAHCLQSDLFKFYLLKKIPEVKMLKGADKEFWEEKLKNRPEKK